MSPESNGFWTRARQALLTASKLAGEDPDAAVSRAYYAAFYATSALFARDGRTFRRHSALEAAVHRDLVKTAAWSKELGASYSWLVRARATADYGGDLRVSPEDAASAVSRARAILEAVHLAHPSDFPL